MAFKQEVLSHLMLIIVLLAYEYTIAASLECFTCFGMTDLSSCVSKTTCQSGQVCYNNRTNTGGQQTFDLGCSNIQKCGNQGNIPCTIVGRSLSERQTQSCHKCCATNLCNRNLCGHSDVFTDCKDIMRTRGSPKSGVYTVNLWQSRRTINVYCDMSTDNGGWTVIQYRFDGSVDFYRNFSQYDNGFGDLSTEFWLGLRDIQELASQGLTDLRIELEAVNGSKGFETFEKFSLSSGPAYTFNVGATIGSLRISKWVSESVGPYHNGQHFQPMTTM
ncbi:fibrinogen-like protein A [Ruditapes philippinarum]|uniref:fibrinogen-like protein A n=1 Tax=Ruditapes philippinarum TaxID=129788 RepID=UPI00295AEFD0|nr:fibrinogen-like protein A [Ruditapes philippinarum]